MIITLCFNIWSATMTNQGDYIPFVVSRLFAGFTGSAATVGECTICFLLQTVADERLA